MARFRIKLHSIMQERGMTRMDIVRGADLNYQTVMKWENSNIERLDATTLSKLASFLGVNESDLYEIVTDEELGQLGSE